MKRPARTDQPDQKEIFAQIQITSLAGIEHNRRRVSSYTEHAPLHQSDVTISIFVWNHNLFPNNLKILQTDPESDKTKLNRRIQSSLLFDVLLKQVGTCL